ncbi:MAG: hypothetical protein QF842_02915 [Candidatus Marinimicrobia bacterium]|jgi:hypothetical protein|nr:hypothetical protein [Candidatus Neomarinimicrobiota bacterium]MDP6611136.1 hypothetical protein [Candidatus Neomarinimicrobiota bacterium]|tara:strand:- start:16928 stop:17758 length:831 start_codon:yes stop_codon:yes gene_type:complete
MNKLFLFLFSVFLFGQEDDWHHIHNSREFSISGLAAFKNGYLVVHDNKKKKQPRVSYLDNKLQITKLIWPEPKLPYDLEAAVTYPNKPNRYILMESTGKCYEVFVDPKDFRVDVLHTFTLPGLKATMNLEGLTIYPSGQGLVFIYGDRGADTRKSTLYTAFFSPEKKSFYELKRFTFDLPEPKKYKRNIADLAIKADGSLWTSATSDPGDDGPFTTAIYELGEINPAGAFTPIHPDLLKPIMVIAGQKVEAMMFHNGRLVLMTDNENFGTTVKFMD